MNMKALAPRWVLSLMLLALPLTAAAVKERTVCVFDIIGKAGDQYNIMTDFRTAALNQGYKLKLKAYTNERIAGEDLSSNQCDAAALTGIRAKQFNKYSGSIDSIGSIPNYEVMRMVMTVLGSNNESVNEKLTANGYTVMGVMPMGAAYLFVKDKSIDNVDALAGKSIAVMEYDKSQARMARRVGMSPKLSDITNFAGRFNNNVVDIAFAPLAAYKALELYKGMKPNGGIIDYVLGQLSMQFIGHQNRFESEFAAWARSWFADQGYKRAMQVINNAREAVPKKWWIRIPEEDEKRYNAMMREARIPMTKDGLFSKDMMTLLRKIRCKVDAGRAECSDRKEIYK
jgi:hypothetical protein